MKKTSDKEPIPAFLCNKESEWYLLNMTPHDLHFYLDGDSSKEPDYTIPKCGICPRMISNPQHKVDMCAGIPVYTPSEFTGVDFIDFGSILPMPNTGVIVARYVAQFLKTSGSVVPGGIYSVDSGPGSAVRDSAGKIIGTRRLEVWVDPIMVQ